MTLITFNSEGTIRFEVTEKQSNMKGTAGGL